jgi:hypothetical protein
MSGDPDMACRGELAKVEYAISPAPDTVPAGRCGYRTGSARNLLARRAAAQADRQQAHEAATQAAARMEHLERELAELRTATEAEARRIAAIRAKKALATRKPRLAS